ncbi:MAG: flagellar biosynthesis protein FlhA [Cycloclasticus sp.]
MAFYQFFKESLGAKSELGLVLAIVVVLMLLFTPVPPVILDILLIVNFSLALTILFLAIFTDKPTSFSTFPSMLLIATLFRLALNISATRLILDNGDAGDVIGAIGEYVVGGNYVIGIVIFFILIVVQYVVVTNGAQRVAEVAARFTLDSMPGKQMSIDADLNMGLIGEETAQLRRKEVEKEANFYGAMDGSTKFVKGDAIAGIIIILIDIIGGLTVGVVQNGMHWSEAMHVYTLLTVGDGIVTQIPALIISTATGIIVTRAASDSELGKEVTTQILTHPKALIILNLILFCMLLIPSIPVFPVLVVMSMVSGMLYAAFRSNHNKTMVESDDSFENEFEKLTEIYPFVVHLGPSLTQAADEFTAGIKDRIEISRKEFARNFGVILPEVKLIENSSLENNEYSIHIFDSSISKSKIYLNHYLAINTAEGAAPLIGEKTTDPTFGIPAYWIEETQLEEAKRLRYTTVDHITVLITHISEQLKKHAPEFITRHETERMLENTRRKYPTIVSELVPAVLPVSCIQSVLVNLTDERVTIKNLERILEALHEGAVLSKDSNKLTEHVRSRLSREICSTLCSDGNTLRVITLDQALERELIAGMREDEANQFLVLQPARLELFLRALAGSLEATGAQGIPPVLVTASSIRAQLKKLISKNYPDVTVISVNEIPQNMGIVSESKVKIMNLVSGSKASI